MDGSVAGRTLSLGYLKSTGRKEAVSITPLGGDIVKVDIAPSRET